MKENLAALGELSAGIAHEFKNALATISGYAQMIRSEAEPGTELREHGDLILQQTRALTHVVTEFLKFARPLRAGRRTSRPAAHDRADRGGSCAKPCRAFRSRPWESSAKCRATTPCCVRRILNLARNAAEAAAENPAGGRVIIRGEIDQSGPLQGQRISISDNGPGIPPEAMTKIFVPFYTTKTNGTGPGARRRAKNRGPARRHRSKRATSPRAEPNSSYGYPLYAKPSGSIDSAGARI